MEKEGFLKMEPGVQRSWLRATKKHWSENHHSRGAELVVIKEHFLLAEQGALVTYV